MLREARRPGRLRAQGRMLSTFRTSFLEQLERSLRELQPSGALQTQIRIDPHADMSVFRQGWRLFQN